MKFIRQSVIVLIFLSTGAHASIRGGINLSEKAIEYKIHKYVKELSGLVLDRKRSAIYAIGDSSSKWDDPERLVIGKIDLLTNKVSQMKIKGATNRDWEAIVIDRHHDIWVLDVGDNKSTRKFVTLYKFDPDLLDEEGYLTPTKILKLTYETGARDVEAGAVYKRGKLLLFEKTKTKFRNTSRISEVDLNSMDTAVAKDIAVLKGFPNITDAARDFNGKIYLLSYGYMASLDRLLPIPKASIFAVSYKWGQSEALTFNNKREILIGNEPGVIINYYKTLH